MKLAVLFPGIGYTNLKPLLYYAGRVAAGQGYEVLPVDYGHFPRNVKGDAAKMRQCFESACAQAEDALKDVVWDAFDDVVFIGKSIGTTVAARYAREHGVGVRLVLLTPLAETFLYTKGPAVAFHGTADPWAATGDIRRLCAEQGIPLHLTENANHSLETGDVRADIATLMSTMEIIERFIREEA